MLDISLNVPELLKSISILDKSVPISLKKHLALLTLQTDLL